MVRNLEVILDENMTVGVGSHSKLSFHQHINNIVCKANQRKSLILRCFLSFLSRSPSHLVRAFKIYVRPLLEYASTTCMVAILYHSNHCNRKRSARLHQARFFNLNYSDRLAVLKLQSLEHRCLIADLALCFHIVKHNTCLNFDNFFTLNPNTNLRGHPFKLTVPLARNNTRKFFFSNRVVTIWNALPTDLVLSSNINIFKYKLKQIDLNKYLIFHL